MDSTDRITKIREKVAAGASVEDAAREVDMEARAVPVTALTTFKQLFDDYAPSPVGCGTDRCEEQEKWATPERTEPGSRFQKIGTHLSISAGWQETEKGWPMFLVVKPSKLLKEAIYHSMLHIERDVVSFECICFPSKDEAVVYAHYNLILGSRVMARIKCSTVPTEDTIVKEIVEDAHKLEAATKRMMRELGEEDAADLPAARGRSGSGSRVSGCEVAIPEDVASVLRECTTDEDKLYLPKRQLGNWQQVKKTLELLGGKWNGGRVQAVVFKGKDAWETVQAALSKGSATNEKKRDQFFKTPDALADRLAGLLNVERTMRVLEPSAGGGALVAALVRSGNAPAVIDVCEANELRRADLEGCNSVHVVGSDFMEFEPMRVYDRVLMNPPFAKGQDVLHVSRAYRLLGPGGRVVALMSRGWRTNSDRRSREFRQWVEGLGGQFSSVQDVEAGAFKESGTGIATCVVVLDRRIDYPLPPSERQG